MVETTTAVAQCLPCLLKPRETCYKCQRSYCLYHFTTDNGSLIKIKGYSNWVCHKCTRPQ